MEETVASMTFGCSLLVSLLSSCSLFTADNKWRKANTTGKHPPVLWSHSMIPIGSSLYVYGGQSVKQVINNALYRLIEYHVSHPNRLKIDSLHWSQIDVSISPCYHHVAFAYGGYMYVHGGTDATFFARDTLIRFDIPSLDGTFPIKLIIPAAEEPAEQQTVQGFSFDTVPNDILLVILGFVNGAEDLTRCARVCKRWFGLIMFSDERHLHSRTEALVTADPFFC